MLICRKDKYKEINRDAKTEEIKKYYWCVHKLNLIIRVHSPKTSTNREFPHNHHLGLLRLPGLLKLLGLLGFLLLYKILLKY